MKKCKAKGINQKGKPYECTYRAVLHGLCMVHYGAWTKTLRRSQRLKNKKLGERAW